MDTDRKNKVVVCGPTAEKLAELIQNNIRENLAGSVHVIDGIEHISLNCTRDPDPIDILVDYVPERKQSDGRRFDGSLKRGRKW